jgi:hypothetical protein
LAFFAASEIADWMTQANIRDNPATPDFDLQVPDPAVCFTAPCYSYSYFGGTRYSTLEAAGAANIGKFGCTGTAFYKKNVVSVNYSTYRIVYDQWYCNDSAYLGTTFQDYNRFTETPQAISWIPSTPALLESRAATPATFNPTWADRLLSSGVAIETAAASLTGPASVAGPSTSKSEALKDAAGQPAGTRTTNTSSVYNVTYAGNTYNVNNVTTTTVTNPDGTSSTTTDSKAQDKPADDLCVKYPDSVGCQSLGSPPVADLYKKSTSAVSVVAANFASSSACPAPLSFAAMGHTYSISYQPLCDRLALLRTLFLMVAGVIAAYILSNTFKV